MADEAVADNVQGVGPESTPVPSLDNAPMPTLAEPGAPVVATVTNLDGSEPERGPDGMIAAADPVSVGTGWKKVSYLAPGGIDLPVEYAGRWWHGNSEHVLPDECAAKLLELPGFSDLGEAPEPYNAQPCTGCGATVTPEIVEPATPA